MFQSSPAGPGSRSPFAVFLACVGWMVSTVPSQASDDIAFFRSQVEPLLRAKCFECHSHDSGKMKGGLVLDSRSGWAEGGEHGPAIVPGQPDPSLLIQAVRRAKADLAMPPKNPLTPAEVALLEDWVRRGAQDPRVLKSDPSLAASSGANWWAIQPLKRRPVPASEEPHPVDAWITSTGVRMANVLPGSDGASILLRRLTIDLHGIIPTPEEVAGFKRAIGPTGAGLGKEIERLLASPRYGERWARHWLDVVHFAETHGHDQDRPRDYAWPYRDYLIDAFNSDKPYARLIQEQIAADALFPGEPNLTPALGFLAAGPWDESSLRDIREDVLDREIGRYLDRDDIVANVMSTFASVTAHCARCHDHKFDPITQRDYYALQAVFAGTEKAERLYDLDPHVHAQRQRWMRLQVALDRKDHAGVEALIAGSLRGEQEEWERSLASKPVTWNVLSPDVWFSEVPSTVDGLTRSDPPAPSIRGASGDRGLRRLEDGSFLAFGVPPATNIYVLTAAVPVPEITALRLEVLSDPSLPSKGPGRAENGNFHLTGFEVFTGSPKGDTFSEVALANASASFNQQGWDIAKVFDDDPITGWGVHPEEGKPHVATFELGRPLALRAGDVLKVVLRQEHGRGHTLGRFRLSTTTQPPPIRASPIPDAVVKALAVTPDRRSAEERFLVSAHYLSGRVSRELEALPKPKRVYAGAHVFPPNGGQKPLGKPREVQVLRRGEILRPLEAAVPGALACVDGLTARFGAPAEESERRAALARWLSDPENPLVWRSIVNRVWHYHFGRGLVETPNDFGRMGSAPSHPELLDWLAVTFRDDLGGSLKRLHHLLLTSRAWRQFAVDPQSTDRFSPLRKRMDAESFRDSVLLLTGKLDDAMGGPSIRQFAMSPGIHVTPNVNYAAYDPDTPEGFRRSIYRFLFRTLPDPLMDAMDSPPGDLSAPTRSESFTALQAFALLNHPFVVRQSEHLATRIARESPQTREQIRLLIERVFLRSPEPGEIEAFTPHVERHGLASLGRLVLNSNEFHFVD